MQWITRPYNNINCVDNKFIVKSGPKNIINGEIFYYNNLCFNILSYFPKLYTVDVENNTNISYIRSYVIGQSLTQLLINKNSNILKNFKMFLQALHTLHVTKNDYNRVDKQYMYNNYTLKIEKRYQQYNDIYKKFENSYDIFKNLQHQMGLYENELTGKFTNYIHGDPIFSNIICTNVNTIVFIDMRGLLGDQYSTSGDIVYDLAKIYQSLLGYDLIINNIHISKEYQSLLLQLQKIFFNFIRVHYNEINFINIKLVTKSLLFSLIPLHEQNSYIFKIWNLCQTINAI